MEDSLLIAGAKGLSRKVDGFAMLEDSDATQWLQANSLVLTNGVAFASNLEHAKDMIESLHASGVSGIFIKFGRHLPEATPAMVSAADACGLPLVSLHPDIKPTQVISVVSYEIFRNEAHDLHHSYDTDLLRDLVIENQDWRILKSRLATIGWNSHSTMGVALVKRMGGSIPDSLDRICADAGFHYCFPLYGKYVALIEMDSENSTQSILVEHAEALMSRIEREFPEDLWRMGTGRVRGNLLMLSVSYKEALYALCMGIADNAKNHVISYQSLGIYASLLQPKSRRELETFLSQLVAALEQHDKQNNTELAPTLRAYARESMSVKKTAEALFVHANTVRYRVDMIRKMMERFVLEENIGASLEILCTFSRWLDVYRSENGMRGRETS